MMKKSLIYLFFLLTSLIFFSCIKTEVESSESTNNFPLFEEGGIEEGWIRIKLNEEVGEQLELILTKSGLTRTSNRELDIFLDDIGATYIERSVSDGGKYRERRRSRGLHLWYDVYFGKNTPVTKAALKSASFSFITIAEPIPVVKPNQKKNPFNDPHFSLQSSYYSAPAAIGLNLYNGPAHINLLKAWEISTGHPDVIVAVIDGGIDFEHPDLAANMWINEAEFNGVPGEDDDGNGFIDDIYGWRFTQRDSTGTVIYPPSGTIIPLDHGTHCAGVISMVNNNRYGGAGIAGGSGNNDGVKVMSCQIFLPDPKASNSYGVTLSSRSSPEAFLYAADNGAVIASCSFGSSTSSHLGRESVKYFQDFAGTDLNGNQTGAMKGGLIIASAGNKANSDLNFPACYDNVISVANLGYGFVKNDGSSYGAWIDISAPGTNIFSTIPILSPNNSSGRKGYAYKSGTSMACPHVSGVAALVLSKYWAEGETGVTPSMLRKILLSSVKDISPFNPAYTNFLGSGSIDAHLALSYEEGATNPIDKINTLWGSQSIDMEWQTYYEDNIKGYEIFLSDQPMDSIDPLNPPSNSITYFSENKFYTINGLTPCTKYYIAVFAISNNGRYSRVTTTFGKTYPDINPTYTGEYKTQLILSREKYTIIDKTQYHYTTVDLRDFFSENLTTNLSSSDFKYFDDYFRSNGLVFSVNPADKNTIGEIKIEWASYTSLLIYFTSHARRNVVITATNPSGNSVSREFELISWNPSIDAEIYPNPVVDTLNIRINPENRWGSTLNIYDSSGNNVFREKISPAPYEVTRLNMQKLSAGVYRLIISTPIYRIERTIIKH